MTITVQIETQDPHSLVPPVGSNFRMMQKNPHTGVYTLTISGPARSASGQKW